MSHAMARDSPERKDAVLKKMLPPHNLPVAELARKDKALAETAALLVLRKKLNAYWGDDSEDN